MNSMHRVGLLLVSVLLIYQGASAQTRFTYSTGQSVFPVIEQILSAGVHGLMLCHARTPGAVKMFVGAARCPFERSGLNDDSIPEGLRGSGSQSFAAQIWGVSGIEYLERADPWPMNPDGELVLSLKLEDKYSLANVDQIAPIPALPGRSGAQVTKPCR